MKSIRNAVPAFFAATALVAAVAWHPAAQAQAKPAAGPIVTLTDPCPINAENWRGKAFYEILFMFRQPNTVVLDQLEGNYQFNAGAK